MKRTSGGTCSCIWSTPEARSCKASRSRSSHTPRRPPDKRWRYATATFHDVLPNAAIRGLAFGVYEPQRKDGGLLSSVGNPRMDWGNKRNIIAIAPVEATAKARLQ